MNSLPNIDPKAAEHAAARDEFQKRIEWLSILPRITEAKIKEADNAAAARIAEIKEAYASGGPRQLG